MFACNKCLENNWKYEYLEGYIRATCLICDNEVEFPSKKLKRTLQRPKVICYPKSKDA